LFFCCFRRLFPDWCPERSFQEKYLLPVTSEAGCGVPRKVTPIEEVPDMRGCPETSAPGLRLSRSQQMFGIEIPFRPQEERPQMAVTVPGIDVGKNRLPVHAKDRNRNVTKDKTGVWRPYGFLGSLASSVWIREAIGQNVTLRKSRISGGRRPLRQVCTRLLRNLRFGGHQFHAAGNCV